MNDNKIRKNQGYLMRRPENSLCCFILASDTDLKKFTESQSAEVERLKNSGYDLFFIYLPREENTRSFKPSRVKFASLEEAKGFIDLAVESELGYAEIFKAIDYVTKTTNDFYTGYTLISLENLDQERNLSQEMESLGKITKLDITLPVLEIYRRPWIVLKDDWKSEETPQNLEESWWKRIFRDTTLENENLGENLYQKGMFATHTSPTLFPFYRPGFFTELLEIFKEEKNLQWLNTFSLKENPRIVISSIIKYFALGWLDRDPMNIDLIKQKV